KPLRDETAGHGPDICKKPPIRTAGRRHHSERYFAALDEKRWPRKEITMKTKLEKKWGQANVVVGAVLLLSVVGLVKAGAVRLLEESRLSFDGDSTLHPFHVHAESMTVSGRVDAAPGETVAQALAARGPVQLELLVPVAQLASGKKGLDQKMREALKA